MDARTLGRSRSPYARAMIARAREETTARLRKEITPTRVRRFDARMTAWSRKAGYVLALALMASLIILAPRVGQFIDFGG